MPLLGTKGAASAQGFGFAGLTAPPDISFIAYTNNLSSSSAVYSLISTAANNAGYVASCYQLGGSSLYGVVIALFLPNGELGFIKRFPWSSYDGTTPFSVCMDDSNIYVVWSDYNPSSSLDSIIVSSISIAGGNVNWNVRLDAISYNNGGNAHAIANGASGELVLGGKYGTDFYYVARLSKTDGSVIASFTDYRSGNYTPSVVYSSTAIYFGYGFNLFRFATTLGSMLTKRSLSASTLGMTRAPSGNVYICTNDGKVASLVSNLSTTAWTRLVSTSAPALGVAADASNNMYVAYSGGSFDKLTSAGALTFSRNISNFYIGYTGPVLAVNDAQVCGSLKPSMDAVFQIGAFKLPLDGSGTGDYGVVSYSTGSNTYASSSLTNSSASTASNLGGIGGATLVSKTFTTISPAAVTRFTV